MDSCQNVFKYNLIKDQVGHINSEKTKDEFGKIISEINGNDNSIYVEASSITNHGINPSGNEAIFLLFDRNNDGIIQDSELEGIVKDNKISSDDLMNYCLIRDQEDGNLDGEIQCSNIPSQNHAFNLTADLNGELQPLIARTLNEYGLQDKVGSDGIDIINSIVNLELGNTTWDYFKQEVKRAANQLIVKSPFLEQALDFFGIDSVDKLPDGTIAGRSEGLFNIKPSVIRPGVIAQIKDEDLRQKLLAAYDPATGIIDHKVWDDLIAYNEYNGLQVMAAYISTWMPYIEEQTQNVDEQIRLMQNIYNGSFYAYSTEEEQENIFPDELKWENQANIYNNLAEEYPELNLHGEKTS